jgi:hypothetical protein
MHISGPPAGLSSGDVHRPHHEGGRLAFRRRRRPNHGLAMHFGRITTMVGWRFDGGVLRPTRV